MTEFRLRPEDRVLVLAPHPDDEVLGAGALILRALEAGASVHVAFATDGETNPWVQRLVERRVWLTREDQARFGQRRRGEALAALSVLGIGPDAVEFLGLPDSGVTELLCAASPRPASVIARCFAKARPTVLVAPAPSDIHPDHGALGVLVRSCLRGSARPPALRAALEYTVHLPPRSPEPTPSLLVVPSPWEIRRLRAALDRHQGPMSWHRRRFLALVARPLALASAEPYPRGTPPHPLLSVARPAGALAVEIRARPRLGSWGPASLVFLTGRPGGPLTAFRIRLGDRDGDAAVDRLPEGSPTGLARIDRRGGRTQVRVSLEQFGGAEVAFAKVERRHGFFDEAGWLDLSGAADPRGAAPGPPVPRVVAVVPCYDVVGLCGPVVAEAARRADRVIVVDDGSRDGTAAVLRACAAEAPDRIEVLSFPENRGKGAALLFAFRHALATHEFDVLVTLDGDGQHRPGDIPAVAAACALGGGLVIGARRGFRRMPLRSRLGNTVTSALLRRTYSACPEDTQSGLRAHSRAFAEEVVRCVAGSRYETEMHVLLLALSSGIHVASVAIPTVYIEGNRSSHFRPVRDGLRVLAALASWWARPRGRASRRMGGVGTQVGAGGSAATASSTRTGPQVSPPPKRLPASTPPKRVRAAR